MKKLSYAIIALVIFSNCKFKEEKLQNSTADLEAFFSKEMPADEPGGAILIMKGDSIVFEQGYGLADVPLKTNITPNTLFNIGSISKTFVSNAILILAEENRLSLNDSLAKYFSNFKNPEIANKVKIKHLLTHTSGLEDNRHTKKDSIFYLTAKDAENWYPITQADSLFFEPGTQFEYSNPAYNALALIIEKVTGLKWQQYVKETIFKPSFMTTSVITDGAFPESGVSHGYLAQNNTWVEKDYGEEPTFAAAGNGGVWSSVKELAKYQLALEQHKFMSAEVFAEAKEVKSFPNWEATTPPFIGWSWFIGKTPDGYKTVGHTGSQGGFLANFVTIPEKEITFIILCNTPKNVDGYTLFITEWLQKNKWLVN